MKKTLKLEPAVYERIKNVSKITYLTMTQVINIILSFLDEDYINNQFRNHRTNERSTTTLTTNISEENILKYDKLNIFFSFGVIMNVGFTRALSKVFLEEYKRKETKTLLYEYIESGYKNVKNV